MSTHNIGFYEDLTKITFELSSNIIKYAPYFFCCSMHMQNQVFSGSSLCLGGHIKPGLNMQCYFLKSNKKIKET